MDAMTDDMLTRITARRRHVETEIARMLREVEALKAELPDLDAAERVARRLAGEGGSPASASDQSEAATAAEAVAGLAKPPNTPTIPEMIRAALLDGLEHGHKGLEPRDITTYIAAKWWPNAPGAAISPICWRMWQRDQLEKVGTQYRLPKNNDAAGQTSMEGLRRRL
jgi:hypothetical protein